MADTLAALGPYSAAAEKLLYGLPDWTAIGTANNAACTATATALAATATAPAFQRVADKAVVSFGAAPTSIVTFTLKDGTTVIFQCQIPAAATAPIVIPLQGLRATAGAALSANASNPGSIDVNITLTGYTVRAP